jgi:UDP-3-O-[3-hydroxymyristoyl] glucosamine N-acyltransferase
MKRIDKTLGEIAGAIGGEARGDPGARIRGVAPIETAGDGDISFIANDKYAKLIAGTKATAMIMSEKYFTPGKNLIVMDNPYLGFALSSPGR